MFKTFAKFKNILIYVEMVKYYDNWHLFVELIDIEGNVVWQLSFLKKNCDDVQVVIAHNYV
jgi:hypothetical protein